MATTGEALRWLVELFGEVRWITTGEDEMPWNDEEDDVQFSAPIQAKKDCEVEITAAEASEWKVKAAADGGAPGHEGETYKALKLTVQITDKNITTEVEGAKPKLVIDHQLNIEKYPYLDKKSGEVRWLGRGMLHQLEGALGFDPVFVDPQGNQVEPFITRTGNKVAPKGVEGVKQRLNPEFAAAFFDSEGNPNLEWAGKKLTADIEVERSEQYGDKNVIKRFKKAAVAV